MAYSLNFSRPALKALGNINEPYYSAIKQAILNLTENPRPKGCKKLKEREGYRIRIGMYRDIYNMFDTKLTIDLIAIGHRKDIYN